MNLGWVNGGDLYTTIICPTGRLNGSHCAISALPPLEKVDRLLSGEDRERRIVKLKGQESA